MKVAINKLASLDISSVVIESVDLSLYIAHVRVGDTEHVITDRQGKVLKTRNLLEMQRLLRKAVSCEFFLRQRSAYDEMVGQPAWDCDNALEVSLSTEVYPTPRLQH